MRPRNGSTFSAAIALLLVVALSPFMAVLPVSAQEPEPTGLPHEAVRAFAPVRWEENLGQADARVKFLGRALHATVFLTADEIVLTLPQANASRESGEPPTMDILRMSFPGGNATPEMVGENQLPGVNHYFLGDDEAAWVRNVVQYGQVRFRGAWDGVDVLVRGTAEGLMEYDFIVHPGADPGAIVIGLHHHAVTDMDAEGNVVVRMPGGGNLTHHAPVAFQPGPSGQANVSTSFNLTGDEIRFDVGAYDENQSLTIDPVLTYEWGTYLGGNGADFIRGVATNVTDDAVFVTGYTASSNFPTQHPNQSQLEGGYDAFVTKFAADGQTLRYSTYLGGSNTDRAFGIAVDGAGSAYVTGDTQSPDFPTVNAFQDTKNTGSDIFVAKLGVGGSILVYSSYLGGGGTDEAYGIAVGNGKEAVVVGRTTSSNFPVTDNALQTSRNGTGDAVVSKISMSGASKLFATYLGGNHGGDWAWAVAVDAVGAAYVIGETGNGFPLANASQSANAGNLDAFVTKLHPSGGWLEYSTYLGGDSTDSARGVAVNATGYAHVVGRTLSTNLPLLGAVDSARSNSEGFLTRFTPTGQRDFSTYLGGSSDDYAYAVTLDEKGHSNVVGATFSSDFPTVDPFQGTIGGDWDAFHTKINTTAQSIYTSTFLGGSADDFAHGVAASCGNVHVVGYTSSNNFPLQSAYQGTRGASQDGFVSSFEIDSGSAARDQEPVPDGLSECREGLQGTSDADPDSDEDGISDLAEWIGNASRDTVFCGTTCAYPSPMIQNLFIEVDFMGNDSHVHDLPPEVYQNLIDRYAAHSIKVDIDTGLLGGGASRIPENVTASFTFLQANYANNGSFFAQARQQVFHYHSVVHFGINNGQDRGICGHGEPGMWFSVVYEGEFDVLSDPATPCVHPTAGLLTSLKDLFMEEIGHNVIGLVVPEADQKGATDRCHDAKDDFSYNSVVDGGIDYYETRWDQIHANGVRGLTATVWDDCDGDGQPGALPGAFPP